MTAPGRDSSSNILRKAARPQGYKARNGGNFGACMRLVNLGLLNRHPGRLFRRTDKPDCRPGRQDNPDDGSFDFSAHRQRFASTEVRW